MNSRLKQFLAAENISQSQFADTIKVVRASVSHVLSGRNNPGYDFIRAIMMAYPKLNMEWLILGKGKMYKDIIIASPGPKEESPQYPDMPEGNLFDDREYTDYQEEYRASGHPMESPAADSAHNYNSHKQSFNADTTSQRAIHQRSVSKIMIFFDDGTYQELSY